MWLRTGLNGVRYPLQTRGVDPQSQPMAAARSPLYFGGRYGLELKTGGAGATDDRLQLRKRAIGMAWESGGRIASAHLKLKEL